MIFQLLVFCEEDFNKTLAGKIRKYNWTEKKHIWFTLYGNNCAEHFFPTPFRTCRPYSTLVGLSRSGLCVHTVTRTTRTGTPTLFFTRWKSPLCLEGLEDVW